ncbi:T9SS type A sorting domain-containing protein, partial [Bacteroidota bacterium]
QVGQIYITPEGGQMPYEYSWTGPPDFSSQLQDITGLKEGMYTLVLTDARGCVIEHDTSIVDGDPISVTHSVSHYRDYNLVCSGDSTGSISVDTVAGNGLDWKNYKYIWNGPGGFKAYKHEIQNLVAGNYHLNVFDSVNCRSDITVTLTQPPPVVIWYDSIISNPCLNDQTSAIYISALNGVEPFSYNWTGVDFFTSTSADITNLAKGRYAISVTDDDGCNSKSDTNLIQVDNIEMVLAISGFGDYNVSCNGSDDGYIKIQSVPGYVDISDFTFLTTGPGGYTSPFRFMTTGIKAGEYHITITDPLGCSGQQDTVLTEPPGVQTALISGDSQFILDSNYTYTLEDESIQSTYTWSVEGGEIWSEQGNESVDIEWRTTGSGKVKVIEMDSNGCWGDTVYFLTSLWTDPTSTAAFPTPNITVYPIPAGNTLYLQGINHTKGSVEFYSLLGQAVLRVNLAEEINLETLERGVYYLRIMDPEGQPIFMQKIIKK